MRVRIDEDMKICPNGQVLELRAGEEHEGPLARWLAEDSGCPVTVLDEQASDAKGGADGAGTDGSLTADLAAASTVKPAAKTAAKSGAKGE